MNALFLLSIFSLVRSLVTCVIGDRNVLHLLVAYAIAVVSVVGYRYQTEVFSWMTCSLGYVFPLSVMLLGVSAYIRGICSKKKRCVIVGVLLGILGAWSTVQIAALTCGLYLLAYLMLMGRGGFPRARIVPLIIIAVLALSCLFAPGLYIRKSEFPATSLGQNILDSIRSLGGSIKRLAGSPFCISAILVMLLGIRWIRPSKPLRPVKLLWTAGFSLLAPIIVAFPVRYSGYIGLPNRALFVIDFTTMIGISSFLVCLAAIVACRRENQTPVVRKRRKVVCWSVLSCLMIVNLVLFPPTEYATVGIITAWSQGEFQKVDDYWAEKFAYLEGAAGQDVTLDTADFPSSSYLFPPCMQTDADNPNNINISKYYHLHSLVVTHPVVFGG